MKKIVFDFLKVHNELGKVTKFWTSRPLFSWRNSHLKKVRADSAPPALIGLIKLAHLLSYPQSRDAIASKKDLKQRASEISVWGMYALVSFGLGNL